MKINLDKKAKIEKILTEVTGKNRERLIDYEDIENAASAADEYFLKNETPKKYQKGVSVFNREAVCNSYKSSAKFTFFEIKKGDGIWFLVDICRADCRHKAWGESLKVLRKSDALFDYERKKIKKNIPL